MSTRFDGSRRSIDDPPLSTYPGWALEMMMGLYGPETIKKACEDEVTRGVEIRPDTYAADRQEDRREGSEVVDYPPFTQFDAELEAMNALLRYLGRLGRTIRRR